MDHVDAQEFLQKKANKFKNKTSIHAACNGIEIKACLKSISTGIILNIKRYF